jgi:pilus assembly protein Flp/PilA
MLHYNHLKTWLQAHFADSDRGASLIEYALLLALIAVVCVSAITLLGETVSENFVDTANGIEGNGQTP